MAWSEKYKASIDCEHPKGFSQRAHCAGRLKRAKLNRNPEIIAYHNTDAEFSKFHRDFIGKSDYGYAGRGFYFSSKPLSGGAYGKRSLRCKLNLQNPYRRTARNWNTDPFNPYSWIPERTEQLKAAGLNWTDAKKLAAEEWTEEAQLRGYDGFIDEFGTEMVVFDHDKIEILEATVVKNPESKLPPDQLVCKSGEYFSPIDLKLSIYGFFKETMSTLINFAKIPQSEVIGRVYDNLPIADHTATRDISGADVNRAVLGAKESYLQTRGPKIQTPTSPEFKRWFEGSVIVDENGEPLVVYHGSKSGGFSTFTGDIAFFTDSIETARTYFFKDEELKFVHEENPNIGKSIYQVYLKILDPLVIDCNGTQWNEIKFRGALNTTREICEYARSIGKDGVIFTNVVDEGEYANINKIPSTVFVVFNNKQIKSAVNNTEYGMDTANIFKNPYEWSADYEAMGQVPYHASMDYHGTVIWLTPQLFLRLCNDLPEESRRARTVDYAAQQWQSGGKVAPPQLYIAKKGEDWQVRGHEGRHRTTVAMMNGATEIPVLVHIYDEYGMVKGREITPQLVESLRGTMIAEEYAKGIRYKNFDFRKYWIDGTLYEDGVAVPVSKESVLSRNPAKIKRNFSMDPNAIFGAMDPNTLLIMAQSMDPQTLSTLLKSVDPQTLSNLLKSVDPQMLSSILKSIDLSKIHRNPPSPNFDELGSGSAANAYRNQDLVEIITKSKRGKYDISRDIVMEVRDLLPENLKKYIPTVVRKRIDKNSRGTLEFIYEMPFYNKVTEGPKAPKAYTDYTKYGYDYPTKDQVAYIESVFNKVLLDVWARAGLKYKRDNAKFDGSYTHQDSLTCNPIFNMGWYPENGKKIMVFRDPLFAWMPVEAVIRLYGSKFPENRAKAALPRISTDIGRYLKVCME